MMLGNACFYVFIYVYFPFYCRIWLSLHSFLYFFACSFNFEQCISVNWLQKFDLNRENLYSTVYLKIWLLLLSKSQTESHRNSLQLSPWMTLRHQFILHQIYKRRLRYLFDKSAWNTTCTVSVFINLCTINWVLSICYWNWPPKFCSEKNVNIMFIIVLLIMHIAYHPTLFLKIHKFIWACRLF